MTDKEILNELTDAQPRPNGIAIRVCWITWPHPHEPKTHWHTVAMLLGDAKSRDTVKERRKLLDNKRYFGVCTECRERNPIGWMHDDAICQSCAESNHGIVY